MYYVKYIHFDKHNFKDPDNLKLKKYEPLQLVASVY